MKKKILLIDNYDSFTYNLALGLRHATAQVVILKNDEIKPDFFVKENLKSYDALVISPGPGSPTDLGDIGQSKNAILAFMDLKKPILGVCLGHQIIGDIFGAKITKTTPNHGKICPIQRIKLNTKQNMDLFANLPPEFDVARYHSLIIDPKSLPNDLQITAKSKTGEIMAIKHKTLPIFGVQFHPESIGTKWGNEMLENFVKSI